MCYLDVIEVVVYLVFDLVVGDQVMVVLVLVFGIKFDVDKFWVFLIEQFDLGYKQWLLYVWVSVGLLCIMIFKVIKCQLLVEGVVCVDLVWLICWQFYGVLLCLLGFGWMVDLNNWVELLNELFGL